MEKRDIIISILIIIIIILILVILVPKGYVNINPFNQSLNNPNNNSDIVSNSGKNHVCFQCGDYCSEKAVAYMCPEPSSNFSCKVINNICTKILNNPTQQENISPGPNCEYIDGKLQCE